MALGADLASELSDAATRIGDAGFYELVEKLNMSLDRGAPIAEQSMQLAQSLRQEQGRALLRQAGSSETKMLIPTVFVILPVTVLFAVFPSVLVLQQSF
jgi:tight adherence protein C